MTRLQNEVARIIEKCRCDQISFEELFLETASQDQALLTLILSIPFLLPVPLPGLSMPFGVLIATVGIRMFFGKSFWFPQYLKHKKISGGLVLRIFEKVEPVSNFISRWVKPRGTFFSDSPKMKRFIFLLISVCGFLLALPLPPGTNSPPALTAGLLSLGVLEQDGLYLLAGLICFLAISYLFFYIAFIGYPQMIQRFGY